MSNPRKKRLLVAVIGVIVAGTAGGTYAAVRDSGEAGPSLPAEKQAIRDRAAASQAALPNDRAAKAEHLKHVSGPPAATPPHPPRVGILESRSGPPGNEDYIIENMWQRVNGNVLTQVFAGALRSDPEQGVVVIRRVLWKQGTQVSMQTRSAPAGDGSLRVSEEAGTQLVLAGSRGAKLRFDPDTEAFVSH